MSYDILLSPCRYDGTTEEGRNPFTLEPVQVPRNTPLSAAEVKAVRAAFERGGAVENGKEDFLFLSRDGARVQIYASNLEWGCVFECRGAGVTPELARLLFDVMVAGNLVLEDHATCIAPNEACLSPHRPPKEIHIASSADELRTLLVDGFAAWKAYRDKAVAASRTS